MLAVATTMVVVVVAVKEEEEEEVVVVDVEPKTNAHVKLKRYKRNTRHGAKARSSMAELAVTARSEETTTPPPPQLHYYRRARSDWSNSGERRRSAQPRTDWSATRGSGGNQCALTGSAARSRGENHFPPRVFPPHFGYLIGPSGISASAWYIAPVNTSSCARLTCLYLSTYLM